MSTKLQPHQHNDSQQQNITTMKLSTIMLGANTLVGTVSGEFMPFVNDFVSEVKQWDVGMCGSTSERGNPPWEFPKHNLRHMKKDYLTLRQCFELKDDAESFQYQMGWWANTVWAYSGYDCQGEGGGYKLSPGWWKMLTTEYRLFEVCWNTNFTSVTAGGKRHNFTRIRSIMID
ncbi:uncharacterized protein LY89DRAFT_673931 [Mollisia scopiformis]|uniref:Uncharacterized protein n=1 Tax=Mollisia scopiformis TaxID=149040 RepID=A0A194WW05_MOLSC|nr:uncharacterized protein LY89DRAFT_673931 [Mollisia scopiformis]KUJ12150.1 hypothetical protein LY89DRAFT_673931 [Mollisia scopiformis]